jgi:ATP-binding cassette subfamily B multidrug efflux pump
MIVVAHRLSTLEFCDRVILVDEGRVIELGSGADVQSREDLRLQIASAISRGEP